MIKIAFTGIDGAGKTTHAKLLDKFLKEEGIPSKYVHLLAPNFGIERWIESKLSNKMLYKENNMLLGATPKKLTKLLTIFGLLFLLRGIYQTWIKIVKNKHYSVIIFDRYAYDDFVRTAWKYKYPLKVLVKLIMLIPKPDVIFYLTLPAEEAWKREKEGYTTLKQHMDKKNYYDKFFSELRKTRKVIQIDVKEKSVEETQREIRRFVTNYEDLYNCSKSR